MQVIPCPSIVSQNKALFKLRFWLLLVLCSCILPTIAWTQPDQSTYFQHRAFDIEDNLGHSYFTGSAECVQGDLGFYWISAESGLYRFDGNKFTFSHKSTFNLTGSGELLHNIDVAGNNWIYEKEPVQLDSIVPARLNLRTQEVIDPDFFVVGTTPRKGKKYFSGISQGNNHLYAWDSENNIYEIIGDSLVFKGTIPGKHLIRNINWVADNKFIIVSTEDRLVFKRLDETNVFHKIELPVLVIDCFAGATGIMMKTIGHDGNIDKQSICYLDFCTDSLYSLDYHGTNADLWILGGNKIDEWVIRKDENLYFLRGSGDEGIREYNVQSTRKLFDNNQEPNHVSILKDQYWFFFGGFIELIQFNSKQFASHLIENKKVSVRSMQCIGDSVVLVNTYRGARLLDISTLEKDSSFDIAGLSQGGYGIATGKNGHLYSGLHGRAILHFDPFEKRSERIPFREQDKLYESGALIPFVDSTGKVWVGLENGLAFLEEKDNKLHHVLSSTLFKLSARFNNVTPAYDKDQFWFATSIGAFLFDPHIGDIVTDIPKFRNTDIINVRQYTQDSVWILPATGPAYLWNKKENSWDSLDIFKDEWQNNLHDILPDNTGCYWVPTNNGLIRYDPTTRNFIRLSMEADGLPFNEFNKLASLILPDGRLVFGGIGGAISIDPENFSTANHHGPEASHRVNVSQATAITSNDETKILLPINPDQAIGIASDAEQLVIDFSCLDPMKTSCDYFYRLTKGKWFQLEKPQLILNELSYNLRTIEFKVVESGTDRLLGETKIKYIKRRPWHINEIAISVYIVLLFFAAYVLLKWRTSQIENKNKKLERLISQRTEELLQDRSVIQKQRDKLEQLTRTQQRLFSIVGHELKSPLLASVNLRQTLSFLLEKRRYNDLDKVALQLKRQAEETKIAIDQLLQWGRMAVYDTPPSNSTFTLKELTSTVFRSLKEPLTNKDLKISCKIPEHLQVTFDRAAMKILIRNFLHNAIKFSPPGGTIEIKYSFQSPFHSFIITDEGKGFEETALQAWNSGEGFPLKTGSAGEKGTGLGLMICEKIAEKNNGKITFQQRSESSGAIVTLCWTEGK